MKHILSLILLVVSLHCQAFFFDPTVDVLDGKTNEVIKVPLDVHTVGKPAPTIVFGHSCSGVSDSYRTNMIWVRILKDWGYNVVVPDSFGPRGYYTVCAKTSNVPAANRVADIIATVKWVKQQPWHDGKIGFIGFSHGGALGEFLSKTPDTGVSAIVEYYPLCQKIKWQNYTPVQIHIGTLDEWTPANRCDPYVGRDNYEVYTYEGATHAFERPSPTRIYEGHRLAYDPRATEQAERRTREFFERNLK